MPADGGPCCAVGGMLATGGVGAGVSRPRRLRARSPMYVAIAMPPATVRITAWPQPSFLPRASANSDHPKNTAQITTPYIM